MADTQNPRMTIASPRRNPAEPACIKINLPNDLRIRLHAHKLITGNTIADTVEAALNMYFKRPQEDSGSEGWSNVN